MDNALVSQGDLGTTLPRHPTGIVWRSGERAEVKLSVRANHGGGWSFRLCPAAQPLTEACMQQTPLDFAQRTWLEFRNGSRLEINGASYYVYAACCSSVELDVLTGEVQVLTADIVYDGGRSLNPVVDIGQVEGSFVQSMGFCLSEGQVWSSDDGRLLNNGECV